MKITRKTITNVVLLIIAAGVFVLIGVRTDWAATWNSVRNANPFWLLGGALFMLSSHILRSVRWTMLTEPAGYKLNARRSFYAVMSGYLVNVATSRGGEIARCALAAKSEKAPVELLIGTVVTERLVDFVMLALCCVLALLLQFSYVSGFFTEYIVEPVQQKLSFQNILIGLVFLLLIAITWIVIKKRRSKQKGANENSGVAGIFERFAMGLKSVFQLKNPLGFIAYSSMIWMGYWASTWCVLQSIDATASLTFLNAISVLIFATVGIAIPLPAGAGVWGAVSLGLQTVYHLPTAQAETYGIFNLAFSNLLMILFGSVSYLLYYLEMQKVQKS